MGAIFRMKYGLESILGRGRFPERPTCVGVDHGISNGGKPIISLVSCVP